MAYKPSAFTLKHNGIANVLKTEVRVSIAFNPSSQTTHPTLENFNAVWDTGATNSVISSNVVSKCGLKPIGMTQVHTVAGLATHNVYFVNIMLPHKVGIPRVRVTEGELSAGFDVLIGMDIITRGDFVLTNKDNKTIFSFRMPSLESIDFVKQINSPSKSTQIVGRNDPCPCGSGKKYKKCCRR